MADRLVLLYRMYNLATGDHLYTTSLEEHDQSLVLGFRDEETPCKVYSKDLPEDDPLRVVLVPMYRMHHATNGDLFYTTKVEERDYMQNSSGYVLDGVEGFVFADNYPGAVPLYRSINVGQTDYLYTTSAEEWENAEATGWSKQFIQCYVYPTDYFEPVDGAAPPGAQPPPAPVASVPTPISLISSNGVLATALERLNRTSVISVLRQFAAEINEHCEMLEGGVDSKIDALRGEFNAQISTLTTTSALNQQKLLDLQAQLLELQSRIDAGAGTAQQTANLETLIDSLQAKLSLIEVAAKQLDANELQQVTNAISTALQSMSLGPVLINMLIDVGGKPVSLTTLLGMLASTPVVKDTTFTYVDRNLTGVTFSLTNGLVVYFSGEKVLRPELNAIEYVFTAPNFMGLPAEFTLRFTKHVESITYCKKTVNLDEYDAVYQSNVIFSVY